MTAAPVKFPSLLSPHVAAPRQTDRGNGRLEDPEREDVVCAAVLKCHLKALWELHVPGVQ